MLINITTKLSSQEAIKVSLDGRNLVICKEDIVKVMNDNKILIEFEVKDFSTSTLTINLKKLMGNDVLGDDSELIIGRKN